MNKREFMFFKDELDITVDKFSIPLLNILLPFHFFNPSRAEKEFRYNVKRLLVKYNLLDKSNKIKIDQNCMDCDKTKFSCPKGIAESKVVEMDVDEAFLIVYNKHFKSNKPLISPYLAMAIIANPSLNHASILDFNSFLKHIRCILVRTAEIELKAGSTN